MTIGRPEVVHLPKGSARRAAPIGALLSRVGQGLNHEEIGSPDGLGVVGKEGTPALAGRPGWPTASVTANGACADGDAELEQLAADALGAPVRVLARHGGDQGPNLRVQAWPAQGAAGPPAPNKRQPWRCHCSTVSGRTKTMSPRRFWWRRRTKSQKSLSRARRRGRCRERRATWSCGRSSRFSMRRRWRPRRTLARVARASSRSSIIGSGSPIDAPPRGGAQTFALLQPSLDFSSRNVLLASEVIGDDTTRSE